MTQLDWDRGRRFYFPFSPLRLLEGLDGIPIRGHLLFTSPPLGVDLRIRVLGEHS